LNLICVGVLLPTLKYNLTYFLQKETDPKYFCPECPTRRRQDISLPTPQKEVMIECALQLAVLLSYSENSEIASGTCLGGSPVGSRNRGSTQPLMLEATAMMPIANWRQIVG